MKRIVISMTMVDDDCKAIKCGTVVHELSATDPHDQMLNAQRTVHYMVEELFRKAEEKSSG